MSKKILVLGDLHISRHLPRTIKRILDKEAPDTSTLVLLGDLIDAYAISSFPKSFDDRALVDEYIELCSLLERVARQFPEVVVVQGNHCARWKRQVVSKAIEPARFLLQKPLLVRAVEGDRYDKKKKAWYRVKRLSNVFYDLDASGEVSWFYRIGRGIFCHPEKVSKNTAQVPRATFEWFVRRGYRDIDHIVAGHTHRLAIEYSPHCVLIENGCLCMDQDYTWHPNLSFDVQTRGYTVIYQKWDGSIDKQSSRVICVEDEILDKEK